MRHLLLAKGLWGLVDGTDEVAEGASDAATREFRQKAQKAFSTIIMAIGTPQLYLVTSCEEPKEAWDNLCGHFERETLANKLFFKKAILSDRNEGGYICGSSSEANEGDH